MVSKTYVGKANIDTGEVSIIINGTAYDSNIYYLRIKERMNEVPTIESNFFDISDSNTDLVEKNTCYLKANGSIVSPLFIINKSTPQSDTFRSIRGVGFVEEKLSDFIVEVTTSADSDSQSGRPQYSGVNIDDIVDEQLAEYTTGITAGTIVSTPINIRSENDTQLSFYAGCADVGNTDWFASYSSDLSTKYINITSRGTDKSSTITLAMSGSEQNCEKTEVKKDFESLRNVIKLFGYGDGVNQLESYAEHSTSVRSKLTTAIDEDDTSIVLEDASDFASSGDVWIGCEKCSYTGKTSNTLTGLTRGIDFRGNVEKVYSHSINSPVSDAQYTADSPQSTGDGSSINTHEQKQKSINARNVIDQSTLDILAEKLLIERKGNGSSYDVPERIIAKPTDYNWALENIGIGDQVTITDTDTNLSGAYRCYGREFIYDIENGNVSVELEFSNTTFSILNEIAKEQNESVSLQKYMQGSTNIYCVPFSENIDSSNAGYLWFYLPEESVAVNRLKLNFNMENYRADAKSITSAPDFYSNSSQWLNNGLAYYKGDFGLVNDVVRNLSFSTRSSVPYNLSFGSNNDYLRNVTITTENRLTSIDVGTTTNFFRSSSGTAAPLYPTKLPTNYTQKQFLIGAFEYDWGSYNSAYASGIYIPTSSGGIGTATCVTSLKQNNSSTVASISGTNTTGLNSYSFSTDTVLSNRSWTNTSNVLAGYVSRTWAYPISIYSFSSPAGSKTIDKIVVSATFNNQYTPSSTSFNIAIQRSPDLSSWTTIDYLSGTTNAGNSTIKTVEELASYGGYYYRLYITNSSIYDANRTTSPDDSSIQLNVKTYYKSVDDLSYGIVKNTSEFTPPGTIDLYIAKDGDSEELIGQYDSNQKNLNISNPTSSWIWKPGNWYYLKFDSSDIDNNSFDGRMRIVSNLYIQLFLNSR